jgi:hypothetical protein
VPTHTTASGYGRITFWTRLIWANLSELPCSAFVCVRGSGRRAAPQCNVQANLAPVLEAVGDGFFRRIDLHRNIVNRDHIDARREKKTPDTRRPGEGQYRPSEPARDWVARSRQRVEPGWLDRGVPAPKQGRRRPVESGSRLAPGPGLRGVVRWRACRVRGRPALCRQRRGGCTAYAGEFQGASPSRFEACLRVWRILAGLSRVLCRLRPWIGPTDGVNDIIRWASSTAVSRSRVRRHDALRASKATHPTAHPRVYFWYLI